MNPDLTDHSFKRTHTLIHLDPNHITIKKRLQGVGIMIVDIIDIQVLFVCSS